jgi:hypothetical protein
MPRNGAGGADKGRQRPTNADSGHVSWNPWRHIADGLCSCSPISPMLIEVANVSMVEAVLEGLKRERLEWTVLLQGLQGSLRGRETVQDIQPDLFPLEVKGKRSMDVKVACSAFVSPQQPSTQQAWRLEWSIWCAQLAALQSQVAGASQSGRSVGNQLREHRCHRCRAVDHLVHRCTHPFAGQGMLRCPHLHVHGLQ